MTSLRASSSEVHGAIVVGAGVMGLATAWHLARLGVPRVAVLERFAIGHERGSSHGRSRIARSAYADPAYVRLMRRSRDEDWPGLEREAACRLLYPSPACFFGPGSPVIEAYGRAVAEAGADVEAVTPDVARRLFPQLRFENDAMVLRDRTAAVVAAADTIAALARCCATRGVEIVEETEVERIDRASAPLLVHTSHGAVRTERAVICAGAWTERLIPALASRLTVKRQTVAFLRLDAPDSQTQLGAFPVWAHLGADPEDRWYGLPAFQATGVKIAQHRTHGGSADDADGEASPEAQAAAVARLEAFAAERFTQRVAEILRVESCLYTSTASEDFVLDLDPADDRIAIGSPCSGHGFKFAPLVGRALAELVVRGRTEIEEFEAMRERFRMPRRGS